MKDNCNATFSLNIFSAIAPLKHFYSVLLSIIFSKNTLFKHLKILSFCNEARTHNDLVRKRILIELANLWHSGIYRVTECIFTLKAYVIYTYIFIYVCICIYICIYILYMCVYVYIYVYIYYIYIYTQCSRLWKTTKIFAENKNVFFYLRFTPAYYSTHQTSGKVLVYLALSGTMIRNSGLNFSVLNFWIYVVSRSF